MLYLLPPNQLEIPLFAFAAPCHYVSTPCHTSLLALNVTHLADVLVKRIHRLVQFSASLLDGLVDVLLSFLPVLFKLLVDLVSAVTSLSGESVNLLAGISSKHLGVLADLGAFAGGVVLSGVLELGCVGWWRIWSAMACQK